MGTRREQLKTHQRLLLQSLRYYHYINHHHRRRHHVSYHNHHSSYKFSLAIFWNCKNSPMYMISSLAIGNQMFKPKHSYGIFNRRVQNIDTIILLHWLRTFCFTIAIKRHQQCWFSIVALRKGSQVTQMLAICTTPRHKFDYLIIPAELKRGKKSQGARSNAPREPPLKPPGPPPTLFLNPPQHTHASPAPKAVS